MLYNNNMQTLSEYLKRRYGKKLYKISINAGLTCPNRDGTVGNRGCIFCSGTGSGDFAGDPGQSITEQIISGKKRVKNKLPKSDHGYIRVIAFGIMLSLSSG